VEQAGQRADQLGGLASDITDPEALFEHHAIVSMARQLGIGASRAGNGDQ
jgi:hypothetical protein